MDDPICASRGPRIGDEGAPRCKRPLKHLGPHRPHPDDGWQYGLCWGNPGMPDLQMREEWVRAGLRPMRIDYRDLVKA